MPAPILTRDFGLLVVGHFLQALGYASMLLLPLYLHHLGASRTEIGTVMAASAATGLLFRPLVGWSLDNVGRKPTLFAGTLVLSAGMGLIFWVESMGPLVYASRMLVGIGEGALFTAYFTFAADLVPAARRTEGLALFGISGLVPLVVNPFAGWIGIEAPQLQWFLPVVGLVVLSSLLAVATLREPPRALPTMTPGPAETLSALTRASLWPAWWATAIFSALVAIFMTFVTVAAESRGIENPAGLWLTYAGGAVLVRTVGARLPERVGDHNLIAPALGAYALALLVAAGAQDTAGFLVAGGLAGLGHGYCFPVLTSQVVTRAPDHLRGSALAVFTALWSVTNLILTPLFGAISDAYDDATMFGAGALLAVAGLGGWVVLEHRMGGAHPSQNRGSNGV